MKNTMKPAIITGNFWTLQFYYPVGKKQMYGQIFENDTEKVIKEGKIKNQEEYDFAIHFLTTADNHKSQKENLTAIL